MSAAFDWQAILAIIVFAMMAFAVFRSGQATPVSTGKLQHDLKNVRQSVVSIEKLMENQPTSADLLKLNGKVEELDRDVKCQPSAAEVERLRGDVREVNAKFHALASKEDVARLDGKVMALDKTIEGVAGHVQSTDAAVIRIEQALSRQWSDK